MGHSGILDTVGKIERAVTQPQLIELLSEVVDPDTLVAYSEAIGHQPRFEPYGDVRDALRRVSTDRGATDQFARDVTIGALIRVAVAQRVVRAFLLRPPHPNSPASRISLATRFLAHLTPSVLSSKWILGAP